MLGSVGCERVSYREARGITRPGASGALGDMVGEELREDDVSFVAICRSAAALTHASTVGPSDIPACTFLKEDEPRPLSTSRHGFTSFASMNSSAASRGNMTLPATFT